MDSTRSSHAAPAGAARGRVPVTVGAALFVVLAGSACGDDPFAIRWEEAPDTALVYSLARPELNLPSAFNFNERRTLRVEAPGSTGSWDVALDTEDGRLVFVTPTVLGVDSRARIAPLPGARFDEVREAPGDTAVYVKDRSVPVDAGTIYVVQTDRQVDAFGRGCVYFAKLEPLVIDAERGTLTFMYDSNPVCNDSRLVPPD